MWLHGHGHAKKLTKQKDRHLEGENGSKKVDWGVSLGGVASGLGGECQDWGDPCFHIRGGVSGLGVSVRIRIGGPRVWRKCQDLGLVPGLGVADWGDFGRIGGILSGLGA